MVGESAGVNIHRDGYLHWLGAVTPGSASCAIHGIGRALLCVRRALLLFAFVTKVAQCKKTKLVVTYACHAFALLHSIPIHNDGRSPALVLCYRVGSKLSVSLCVMFLLNWANVKGPMNTTFTWPLLVTFTSFTVDLRLDHIWVIILYV